MLASIPLKDIQIQDRFWKERLDLVRKEIIPYLQRLTLFV